MIRSSTGGSQARYQAPSGYTTAMGPNAEAVGLRAEDSTRLRQTQFLQPALQVFPGGQRAVAIAAFRCGLIAAEKDVPAGAWNADRLGHFPESLKLVAWHMINLQRCQKP